MSDTTSNPPMLTADLCEQLDQRLREIGAPIARLWRPGLDDGQMDELTAEIGLTLSAEARAWWGWHDGVKRDVIRPQPAIGDGWVPLSLSEAVHDAISKRDMATRSSAATPGDHRADWAASWIAFCGNPSPERLACDCAVPTEAPSPVLYFDPEGNDNPHRPKAASMGVVVSLWLQALADGTWHIDPSTGDFALLDPIELLKTKGADTADLL